MDYSEKQDQAFKADIQAVSGIKDMNRHRNKREPCSPLPRLWLDKGHVVWLAALAWLLTGLRKVSQPETLPAGRRLIDGMQMIIIDTVRYSWVTVGDETLRWCTTQKYVSRKSMTSQHFCCPTGKWKIKPQSQCYFTMESVSCHDPRDSPTKYVTCAWAVMAPVPELIMCQSMMKPVDQLPYIHR